jgi:hypothetical protein
MAVSCAGSMRPNKRLQRRPRSEFRMVPVLGAVPPDSEIGLISFFLARRAFGSQLSREPHWAPLDRGTAPEADAFKGRW